MVKAFGYVYFEENINRTFLSDAELMGDVTGHKYRQAKMELAHCYQIMRASNSMLHPTLQEPR